MSTLTHTTVLLEEAVAALNIRGDGIYVDGTFGRGGHSRRILEHLGADGRLVVFDKDPQAICAAQELAEKDQRVRVVHSGFADFQAALARLGIAAVDGVLLDLGVSSPQIDDGTRGFSFRFDAPLDMRMDTTTGQTAAAWLNSADEAEIADVVFRYGEERFARQIARAVVQMRRETPLATTAQLARLCAQAVKTREKGQDPATRTFQAVRIFINRELDELQSVLPQITGTLKRGGRMAVIAFHSLEDRMVKQFIKTHSSVPALPRWAAVKAADLPAPPLRPIGKAIKADAAEIAANPRARSAVLRTAERTDAVWQDSDTFKVKRDDEICD